MSGDDLAANRPSMVSAPVAANMTRALSMQGSADIDEARQIENGHQPVGSSAFGTL